MIGTEAEIKKAKELIDEILRDSHDEDYARVVSKESRHVQMHLCSHWNILQARMREIVIMNGTLASPNQNRQYEYRAVSKHLFLLDSCRKIVTFYLLLAELQSYSAARKRHCDTAPK